MPITHVPPGVPYDLDEDEAPNSYREPIIRTTRTIVADSRHRDATPRTANDWAALECCLMAMKAGVLIGFITYFVVALSNAFGLVH